ncbi:hypothetical protein T4D_334 [Trichinella pseudospiralis]|uniref:Uncharacterized protein n=1 Tax=Trichinella pseudospiralis TaxID=6337 RepID=A0A0V1FMS2_TRIPS|nr:hypothetical protein T4D_334 [Trichinella pseudospiralis]
MAIFKGCSKLVSPSQFIEILLQKIEFSIEKGNFAANPNYIWLLMLLNHTNCKRASQSVHSGRDNAVILLKKKTKLNCNLASISSLKLRTDNSPDSAFFSCNNEKYSTTNVG